MNRIATILATGMLALLFLAAAASPCIAVEPASEEEALRLPERAALALLRDRQPDVRTHVSGGRVTRLYGAPLSRGASPEESAAAFVFSHIGILGAETADMVPGNHFNDRPAQPVMPARDQEGYRFTLIYYRQERNGIPVYGADLRLLVRNEEGFPLVLAASSLRELGGLSMPSKESLPTPGDVARRRAQAEEPGLAVFSPPRYVIWAGIEDTPAEPRLAVTFDTADSEDPAMVRRGWRFVADAATGEILHRESLVQTDVSGRVRLRRTAGYSADMCLDETAVPMPYARLFIWPVTTSWANRYGNYTIGTPPWDVTVESNMEGQYFKIETQQGENENLKRTVASDASGVGFLHNANNNNEARRAQANGYYFANIARWLVLEHNPDYPTIKDETGFPVYVNHPEDPLLYPDGCPCNAWSWAGVAGFTKSINFCRSSADCSNTAFGDVILHEYGHHAVDTGGSGQGQYGEGMGDVFALLKTDSNLLGIGFGKNCSNELRDADNNIQFPCAGEIHSCGRLLSGAVWDTREALIPTHPSDYLSILGDLMINSILLHQGRRIDRSITVDILTLDDDDASVINGTPHGNEILAGFEAHNLQPNSTTAGLSRVRNVLASKDQCDGVLVAWDAVPNAYWYTVWRNTVVGSADFVQVGSASGTSYLDTSAARGTEYFYRVRAHNGYGHGSMSFVSLPESVGIRPRAARKVTGVAASDGTECGIRVTWQVARRARSYKIWRAYALMEDPVWFEVGSTTGLEFYDTGAAGGDSWLYRVQGIGADCPGPMSEADYGYARGLPPPPETVDASDGTFCGGVRVTWSAVTGAASYEVWRNTTAYSAGATLVGTAAASPFDDTSAAPGVVYWYWVRCRNDCGLSALLLGTAGSAKGPPAALAGLTASQGAYCNYVRVSWMNMADATSYEILRGTTIDPAAAASLGSVAAGPFDDTTAVPGQVYHYWVRAHNNCGPGAVGSAGSGWRPATPATPVLTGASDNLCGYVRLSWNAAAGAASYEIWRNAANSTTGASLLGTDDASPYDDLTAIPGVSYWYWVKAYNQCDTSGFSGSDSGVASPAVAAPTGVVASDGTCGYTRVSWSPSAGATGYRIYRHTSSLAKDAAEVGSSASSPWDDTTATPGQTYYYWVGATDVCGVVHLGAGTTGWRNSAPSPPGTVSATGAMRWDVEVTWSSVSGAVSYEVWRNTSNSTTGATLLGSDTASPYVDGTAAAYLNYWYFIKAVNGCGAGGFSPSAGAVVVPPG